ncbi:MAG: CHAT domain-containing protein [Calditrichaeota bacterium]|nr:CHAT domain-containing protein [Calditrichota bacterium]
MTEQSKELASHKSVENWVSHLQKHIAKGETKAALGFFKQHLPKNHFGEVLQYLGPDESLQLIKIALQSGDVDLAFTIIKTHAKRLPGYAATHRFGFYNNLAICLVRRRNYLGAHNVYDRCERIIVENSGIPRRDRISLLNNKAILLWKMGHYTQAREAYRGLYDDLCAQADPEIDPVTVLINLSTIERSIGRYGESYTLLKRVFREHRQRVFSDEALLARLLFEISITHFGLSNFRQCETLLEKVIQLRRKVHGPFSIELARVLTTAAQNAHRLGQHPRALVHLRGAFQIHAKRLSTESERFHAHLLLFQICLERGRDRAAAQLLVRCQTANLMQDGSSNTDLIHALHEAVRWRLSAGRFPEALVHLLTARRLIRKALPTGHEFSRNGLLAGVWLLLQGQYTLARRVLLKSYVQFMTVAQEDVRQLDVGLVLNLVARQGEAVNLILMACMQAGVDCETQNVLESWRNILFKEVLARRAGHTALNMPNVESHRRDWKNSSRWPDGDGDVQITALYRGLSFSLGTESIPGSYFAVRWRKGAQPVIQILGETKTVDETLAAFSATQVIRTSSLTAGRINRGREHAKLILSWFVGPLADPPANVLHIVPDGRFHQINPLCLMTEQGVWVAEKDLDIRMHAGELNSTSDQGPGWQTEHVLILGVDYHSLSDVTDLPGISLESQLVSEALKTARVHGTSKMLTSLNREECLRDIASSTVLHFMGHGIVQKPGDPLASQSAMDLSRDEESYGLESVGILLGMEKPGEQSREFLLTGEEISRMDLRHVKLVVLSLCYGTDGTYQPGFGLLSIRRAFEMAGVQGVLSSPAALDDRESPRWMRAFYEECFQNGLPPSRAVKAAARRRLRELKKAGRPPDPAAWGAFQYVGW